jgi:hypothetical protein
MRVIASMAVGEKAVGSGWVWSDCEAPIACGVARTWAENLVAGNVARECTSQDAEVGYHGSLQHLEGLDTACFEPVDKVTNTPAVLAGAQSDRGRSLA